MSYTLVGLGNTGSEYEHTRHNAGREALLFFAVHTSFPEWKFSKKDNALLTTKKIGKEKVTLILPETMMNASGKAIKSHITSVKRAQRLVVLYDDIDIAFGKVKLSRGRSSGGHRGVESIIKQIKTKDFLRVRIGITPADKKGRVKKPQGEKEVLTFLLGTFSPKEKKSLEGLHKRIETTLSLIIKDGYEKAVSRGV